MLIFVCFQQTVVKQFELNPYNTNSSGNCTFNNSSQTLSVMGENITVTFAFGENFTTNNYNVRTVNVLLVVNNYTLPNSTCKYSHIVIMMVTNILLLSSKLESIIVSCGHLIRSFFPFFLLFLDDENMYGS